MYPREGMSFPEGLDFNRRDALLYIDMRHLTSDVSLRSQSVHSLSHSHMRHMTHDVRHETTAGSLAL